MLLRNRLVRRSIAAFSAGMLLLATAWYFLPPPPLPLKPSGSSHRLFDRHGRLLRMTLTGDDQYRLETPLKETAPELIQSTLLHEDQHFWHHPGVNPISLLRAASHFAIGQRGYGGASTLTMQLARIRFGIHTRTARGKLLQVYRALQIERHYSKQEILETYLNVAPYGRNIQGIGAASLLYYGKPASRLSLHESVVLSVLPQSPTRRSLRTTAPDASLASARNRLFHRLEQKSAVQNVDSIMAREFDPRIELGNPFSAPHFAQRVLAEFPDRAQITATLDSDLQRMLERRIRTYIESNQRLGIRNAAAMLVDFHTMEVLAQIGSADFFSESIGGQNDGTRQRRSPGSTLKPFIYALAIDQGLIHPLTILKDAPRSFGGYNPENFDGEFSGPISATDALARSRNLPAVSLAAELAHPRFYEFLRNAGVALQKEEGYYGLSLPLGGGEVSMEELVRLYCALANGGRFRELHRTFPASQNPGIRILSSEASFLTLQMLGHVSRPGMNSPAGDDGVYWKTGTSHGFHDAWSIAVFDRFVLAVWVGNFDGRSNAAFVGRTCAGPLLFHIIDAMRTAGLAKRTSITPPPGANLQEVEFCAISGQIPTEACTHRLKGWFVPGISPITTCEVHREILVDTKTGLRVATDDGTREIRREVYEFWPSDLLTLFEKAGVPRRLPPPFGPDNRGENVVERIGRSGRAPEILSPQNGRVYVVGMEDEKQRSLSLRAQTDADVAKVYWFAGKSFLGAVSSRDSLSWHAAPGTYRIVALDDHGRSSSCNVILQAAQVQSESRAVTEPD